MLYITIIIVIDVYVITGWVHLTLTSYNKHTRNTLV